MSLALFVFKYGVYVVLEFVCVNVYWPGIDVSCIPQLLSIFLRQSLLSEPEARWLTKCLANELQGSTPVWLPRIGIIGRHCHAWHLHERWGSELRESCVYILTGPSFYYILVFLFLFFYLSMCKR